MVFWLSFMQALDEPHLRRAMSLKRGTTFASAAQFALACREGKEWALKQAFSMWMHQARKGPPSTEEMDQRERFEKARLEQTARIVQLKQERAEKGLPNDLIAMQALPAQTEAPEPPAPPWMAERIASMNRG